MESDSIFGGVKGEDSMTDHEMGDVSHESSPTRFTTTRNTLVDQTTLASSTRIEGSMLHRRIPQQHPVHSHARKRARMSPSIGQSPRKRHKADDEVDFVKLWDLLPVKDNSTSAQPQATSNDLPIPSSAFYPPGYVPHPDLATFGINPSSGYLDLTAPPTRFDPDWLAPFSSRKKQILVRRQITIPAERPDFFARLATYPELLMDVALQMRLPSLISLFAISRDFNTIISDHLSHFTRSYAHLHAPESNQIYNFHLYADLCIYDPVGRLNPQTSLIRKVPSLRWLQMVIHREKTTRDILALLARESHRCPRSMSLTLRKMWLLMDISTSVGRSALMHNEIFFTDYDVYNMVFFCVKFDMWCSHPIAGPGDSSLREVLVGQRGLTPLRDFMIGKRFRTRREIMELCWRYELRVDRRLRKSDLRLFGMECQAVDIGRGHLEGWGRGNIHLLRPDECALRESVRRRLGLERHLIWMIGWGYVDPVSRRNLHVSEEEKYMSDEEEEKRIVEGAGWSGIRQKENDVVSVEEWVSDDGEDDGEADGEDEDMDDEEEDEDMESGVGDEDDMEHGFSRIEIQNEMVRQEVLHDYPFL